MAIEETPLDESTTSIPPQATGNSLPGQAASLADWADVQPASDIESELLKARLGDTGAANYQALRSAGQQSAQPATSTGPPAAPAPSGGLSALAGAPPAAMASGVPAGGFNPLYTLLAGQGAEQGIVANNLKVAAAHQVAQVRQQQIADADRVFLEKLQNEPLNVRAPLIQRWAAAQGRVLSDAETNYVANIKPDVMDHTIKMAANGDVTAQANLKSLLGGNPIDMLTAKQTMEARNADAITKTTTAQYAPQMAEAKLGEMRAKAAKEGAPPEPKTSYQGWRLAALDELKKQHIINPTDSQIEPIVRRLRAKSMGESRRETTAASPIPVGTADKLAGFDTAIDIINQLKALYAKGSPTDEARKSWLNRVKQEVNYRWGFDMPDNLDEDTALRSLGAITAGRAFIQGRPNQQLMAEIWKHTGQNPLVSPNQMRDRLGIMERQVRVQQDKIKHYTQMGREDLANEEAGGSTEGTQGTQDNPIQVQSKEEAAALPKGAYFRNPAGQLLQR